MTNDKSNSAEKIWISYAMVPGTIRPGMPGAFIVDRYCIFSSCDDNGEIMELRLSEYNRRTDYWGYEEFIISILNDVPSEGFIHAKDPLDLRISIRRSAMAHSVYMDALVDLDIRLLKVF